MKSIAIRVSAGPVLLLLSLAVAGALVPRPAAAAGPWTAEIVDAETGAPLEGVAVLAIWERRAHGHPAIGLGRTGYHSSREAVTGADGRFRIPGRFFLNPPPFFPIEGPELFLFKGGYGGWRFRAGAEDLTAGHAVIEMRPLPTRAERARYLENQWADAQREALRWAWRHGEHPASPIDVPWQRARTYEAAINAEGARFGFRPIGIGFPSLWTHHLEPTPPERPGEATLRGASGVAIDAAGMLYVADTDNHRIMKYSPTLEVLGRWGTFGRDDGQFQFPRGIAVDRQGRVWVADWGNHRVQQFSADGRFLGKWGELRFDQLGGTFTPKDIAAADDGEIVVFTGYRVYRFTPSGRLLGVWGAPSQFSSRSGIAVGADGTVVGINGHYLLDRPQVLTFDRTGNPLAAWGQWGRGPGQISDPAVLAVGPDGHVYLRDWIGRPRILKFDPRGTLVGQWERGDTEGGELQHPVGLAIGADGTLYIADRSRPSILRIPPREDR